MSRTDEEASPFSVLTALTATSLKEPEGRLAEAADRRLFLAAASFSWDCFKPAVPAAASFSCCCWRKVLPAAEALMRPSYKR